MAKKIETDAILCAVDLMEKEILYFTGKRKAIARRKYLTLLKMCGKNCQLEEPIYLNRI